MAQKPATFFILPVPDPKEARFAGQESLESFENRYKNPKVVVKPPKVKLNATS